MLIFIENHPRAYAWGSRDALPELLGTAPNGEPQAELWLGAHPGAPASVAKATPKHQTLIELIESDPGLYGVDDGPLPFLLKLLAIGAPLSLQVHPDKEQAERGFAREEAAGVPLDAGHRNYGDDNHKPELLVALGEVTALSGFRPIGAARAEFAALAAAAPEGPGREALEHAAALCEAEEGEKASAARSDFLVWALGGGPEPRAGAEAVAAAVAGGTVDGRVEQLRIDALRELTGVYPGDPGVLISLLLHLVKLAPGEAVYLGARQMHAYQSGLAVEVMSSSDNVLRAGFTEKHVDADELMRIVDTGELADPRFPARALAPGLVAWEPDVPDFRMLRARLRDRSRGEETDADRAPDSAHGESAETVRIETPYPLVLVVTSGRVRVERVDPDLSEVASAGRGQSLYVSAGRPIELSGCGEAFLATVGSTWGVSNSFK